MNNFFKFLRKKNIEFTAKRYFVDVLGFMAFGLFSSLLIGTILNTIGLKFNIKFLSEVVAPICRSMTGATIGVAVAYALKSPPLVLFSSVITGATGNALGGPAGALIAACIGAEFGKLISKETKLDILLTPTTTVIIGVGAGGIIGPLIGKLMFALGKFIMYATDLQPFFMGVIISVVMGMILTLPISSAALAIMLNLGGLAGGAATIGCSAQMIGFAVISFKENGWGGFFAQGFGTSMLQMPNIIKNWKVWIPAIISSAILGPVATIIFKLKNIPLSSGMGTSGLVGQYGTVEAMKGEISTAKLYLIIFVFHFFAPAIISLVTYKIMKKFGHIKDGDLKIETSI
ncbi:MAG: PTS transporter subunit IIC [Fusobacteriaceae bacterium]